MLNNSHMFSTVAEQGLTVTAFQPTTGMANRVDLQNETIVAAFSVALSGEREKAQLTQEELAERADVSARFISFLETGRRQPSLSTLYALSKGLRITMQDLIAAVERHHDADTVDAETVGPKIPSD